MRSYLDRCAFQTSRINFSLMPSFRSHATKNTRLHLFPNGSTMITAWGPVMLQLGVRMTRIPLFQSIHCRCTAWLIGSVLILSVSWLGLWRCGVFDSKSGHPRLVLSSNEIDLGAGKPNEALKGVLVFSNSGDAPLAYQLERSCGCTDLSPSKGTLFAGQSASIIVGLHLPENLNSERAVNITIKCNDPLQPMATCSLLGRCISPFKVTPSYIAFGEVLEKDVTGIQREFEVHTENGVEVVLDKFQSSSLLSKFNVTEVGRSERLVKYVVTLAQGITHGANDAAVRLKPVGKDHIFQLPIHANVVTPVSLVPSTVFLRKDPDTGVIGDVDVLVVSRESDDRTSNLWLVAAPEWVTLRKSERLGKQLSRLRLGFKTSDRQAKPATLKVAYGRSTNTPDGQLILRLANSF